jgi:hypothetical protein
MILPEICYPYYRQRLKMMIRFITYPECAAADYLKIQRKK